MQHTYDGVIRYGVIPLTVFLALFYLLRGYHNALLRPEGSNDLQLRYQEQQYVVRGVNPNDVYEVLRGYSGAKAIDIDPTIPLPVGAGGYPPWAYFTALFLVPVTSWPVTKVFFAVLNAVSLGVMAWFTYGVTRPYGRMPALGLLTSVLAMGANSFVLGSAQYGLVINAMIAGMAWCLAAGKPTSAGLLYGLSLVKPSIAAPFLFVLIARRRWLAIIVAVGYIALASMAISVITGTDPITMLLQTFDRHRAGGSTMYRVHWPIDIASLFGISEQIVLIATAIAGLGIGFLVIWAFRRSQLIVLLGTASVFGYLWTVHRAYDDVMMAFLLIAIGHLALKEPKRANGVVFALVAISLWLPPRVESVVYITYGKLMIWVFALAYMLVKERAVRSSGQGVIPSIGGLPAGALL